MEPVGRVVKGVGGAVGSVGAGTMRGAGTLVTGAGEMVSMGGTAAFQAGGHLVTGVGGMVSTGGTAAVQGVGQVVKGVGGMFGAVGNIFDGGKSKREKEHQQMMAAEQMRLEEEMRMRKAAETKFEQRPVETPSKPQVPDCFKCGSSTRMTFCSHFFCPNCHVYEGKVHCPVCQKIFS